MTDTAPALDPITVEVIGAALSSIVEETGEALVRASYSTNVKERRDCSTALFDRAGRTLCQAEHIPVHLGSFLDFIPMVLSLHDAEGIRPGDVFVGNDAYQGGGTHLPDITVVTPVFDEAGSEILFFVASRGHHADVGGGSPGCLKISEKEHLQVAPSSHETRHERARVVRAPFKKIRGGLHVNSSQAHARGHLAPFVRQGRGP